MIVAELRQTFPLRILLKISRLPRSTFYYHLKASCEDKHRADKQAIMEVLIRYNIIRKLKKFGQKYRHAQKTLVE